jgi:hypothetical protein
MAAPTISLRATYLHVHGEGDPGLISLQATKAVHLSGGTLLEIAGVGRNGGAILIDGGARFTIDQSMITAVRFRGLIQIKGNQIELTDTQITTNPLFFLGAVTLDGKNTALTNTQILGFDTIDIRSPGLRVNAGSVFDASTLTINGVVQP